MPQDDLIPHLFRTESGKIASVLCRHFGFTHLQNAEDITSETFLTALETWPYRGVPENPVAWLYTVAKNKARNYLKRQVIYEDKVIANLDAAHEDQIKIDIDLSDRNITDSQLRMLFAICDPVIDAPSQIGLALRILCGFGIDEIANALLTNKETINKRLYRAREKLRTEQIRIEFPEASELPNRLENVLTTLYLLFNEGYYSETNNDVLREDLCLEAMRLTNLLLENHQTNLPIVNALMALMCFHASRFEARMTDRGEIILYGDQDEKLWNQELIAQGAYYFHQSSGGESLSKYHMEAGIAYWHTIKEDTQEKWENILHLHNLLLQHAYSPIAALNRTYAYSKVHGKEAAIGEAEKLNLTQNPYYHTLLGELYTDHDTSKAKENLQKALDLARSKADRLILQKKLDSLLAP